MIAWNKAEKGTPIYLMNQGCHKWAPVFLKNVVVLCISHTTLIKYNQFSSVSQSCLTLCDPMDCSTPGIPVHHQLLEFTQTHVHRVSDAIQPSHPLSSPSPPAVNLSQHQGLFQWVSYSNQVAKAGVSALASVLPMNTQDWSPLGWTGWISLQSKGLSRVFSNATAQKHQFFSAQLSLWSNSHIHTSIQENIILDLESCGNIFQNKYLGVFSEWML